MRPDLFDAQSNRQQVPILSNPVGAISDVHCDSGGSQGLGCVYPVTVTEPPTPASVTFQPTYYVTTLGLAASPPAPVTTSATPWQTIDVKTFLRLKNKINNAF